MLIFIFQQSIKALKRKRQPTWSAGLDPNFKNASLSGMVAVKKVTPLRGDPDPLWAMNSYSLTMSFQVSLGAKEQHLHIYNVSNMVVRPRNSPNQGLQSFSI